MHSTGRMHGFESLAEQRLLLALDFVGGVDEVLAQPFRLKFTSDDGRGEHTPDFLVVAGETGWLLDVRPAHLIKERDVLRFAAAERAAAAVGWRYTVVTGWRRQVLTGLDALSARRRALSDPLGLEAELLESVRHCPRRLGELVEATPVAAAARAHLLHLLWHRRLATDLAQPLEDASWIYTVSGS
ncbi:TnsA-like heteromeric transposase endonuclease subunit [Streptomyces antimycoticus]|uniref:TnsA-like heteromeric transposase endonuclease subunit n=1 Tax=Streptomyces antimycoticus TaxID=68175 RepID=UPI001F2DE468|nr:TnsA-like heteromeric transposase endonuclease subunit [Streptomyces antimycoticus]